MKDYIYRAQKSFGKNAPTILAGLSVAGVISTVTLGMKAAPAGHEVLKDERWRRTKMSEVGEIEPITLRERIELTWRIYIPTFLSAGATIGCIIAGNRIHLQRAAALASLYSITEAAFMEYQDKVIEIIGAKKEGDICDEIAQDRLNFDTVEDSNILMTGKGDHLMYDSLSGRYFRSDIETVRKVINDFNEQLLSEMFLPLNDFYDELGLEGTELGRSMGWDVEKGLLSIRFSAKIATNGDPCIVMDYAIEPKFL